MKYYIYLCQYDGLDNTYNNVYASQEILNRALAEHVILQVETDTLYIRDHGDITIPLSGNNVLDKTPNYMLVKRVADGSDTVYIWMLFITQFEFINNVIRVSYSMDYWHTYVDKINLIIGRRTRTNIRNNTHAMNLINRIPETMGTKQIVRVSPYGGMVPNRYDLVLCGYLYTGEIESSKTPSKATPFITFTAKFSTPPYTPFNGITIDELGEVASELLQRFSSYYDSQNRYAQVTNIWAVPYGCLSNITEEVINNSKKIDDYDLISFEINGSLTRYDLYTYIPTADTAEEIYDIYPYDSSYSITYQSDNISHITGYGTLRTYIEIPDGINSGNKIYLNTDLQTYGISVRITGFGQTIDITDDLIVNLTFTPEQMQAVQERITTAKTTNANTAFSIVGSIFGTIGSALTGNVSGAVNGIMGAAQTATTNAINQTAHTYSEVGPVKSATNDLLLTQGVGFIAQDDIKNLDSIIYDVQWNGYETDYFETTIEKSNTSFTVVQYSQLDIGGIYNPDAVAEIKRILTRGTRIWNEPISSTPTNLEDSIIGKANE